MNVSIIETTGLGDRSYLVTEGDIAVVVDPQRDIDRVLDLAREHGVRITHVLETHIHNDYVTGGLELARVAGAEYVVPAGDDVALSTTRHQRRRRHRRRTHPAARPSTRPATPTTTSATSSTTTTARRSESSPAARCCTARPDAPTWSAKNTPTN